MIFWIELAAGIDGFLSQIRIRIRIERVVNHESVFPLQRFWERSVSFSDVEDRLPSIRESFFILHSAFLLLQELLERFGAFELETDDKISKYTVLDNPNKNNKFP